MNKYIAKLKGFGTATSVAWWALVGWLGGCCSVQLQTRNQRRKELRRDLLYLENSLNRLWKQLDSLYQKEGRCRAVSGPLSSILNVSVLCLQGKEIGGNVSCNWYYCLLLFVFLCTKSLYNVHPSLKMVWCCDSPALVHQSLRKWNQSVQRKSY